MTWQKVVKKFFCFSPSPLGQLFVPPAGKLFEAPAIFRRLRKLFANKVLGKNADFHRGNGRRHHQKFTIFLRPAVHESLGRDAEFENGKNF